MISRNLEHDLDDDVLLVAYDLLERQHGWMSERELVSHCTRVIPPAPAWCHHQERAAARSERAAKSKGVGVSLGAFSMAHLAIASAMGVDRRVRDDGVVEVALASRA